MAEKFSRRLFFFILIFAPLAFGTVEPWSYAVMETAAAAALLLYFIHAARNGTGICEVPGLVFLALFLLFILIQAVPLPSPLVQLISPAAFEIQQNAAFARGGDFWMTLSVHPRATVEAFLRYASYAAFYVLTVQILSYKDMLKKTVIAVTVFGAALAFSSILQLYLTEDMAMWVRHVPENSMIVGPYICHNHYAGLMEMIFPVALALFFFYRPKLGRSSFIRSIIEILGQEKANIHILIGAAALLIGTSIFLSMSRGGIISTCLAFFFFLFLISRRRITRGGTVLTALVVILICLSVSWFGWDAVFERFAQLKNEQGTIENSRFDYWKDSSGIVSDYPAVGAGFGTFADVYRHYQSVDEKSFVNHAHNDYIELAAQGGIIAFLLVAGFIGTVFYKTFRAFSRRRDAYCIYIYTGAVTGVIALLFHSFSDFNLQIGANGLWFFFLLGLAVSAANTRVQLSGNKTMLKTRSFAGGLKGGAVAAGTFLLTVALFFNLSFLVGDFYYSNIEDYEMRLDSPAEDQESVREIAGYASAFDFLNAKYAFKAADAAWLLGRRAEAKEDFLRAVFLNPAKALYYKRYGLFLAQAGQRQEAAEMLGLSVRYDPVSPENALECGALLVAMERDEKGLDCLKKAVSLDTRVTGKVFATLSAAGFEAAEMAAAVPDTPGALAEYAKFLNSIGKADAAEKAYQQALGLMEKGGQFKKWSLYRIYRFYTDRGMTDKAMDVMLRAEKLLPGDAGIKIRLGDLYRKQGILYKAKEKYEAALIADPDSRSAQRRLERLNR